MSERTTWIAFEDMAVRPLAIRSLAVEKDPLIGSVNRCWRVLLGTTNGTLRSKPFDFDVAMAEFHRLSGEIAAKSSEDQS